MSARLDCVVVGYNDVPVDEMIERVAQYKDTTGSYRHLLANTVSLRGKRVKYPELFNAAYERATGRPGAFNVAKVPNLGAAYLTSFLRKRGFAAEVVNFFNADQARLAALLDERPAAVAITTTYYYESRPIREIVDFVRGQSPATKIVVGGPHIYNLCTDLNEAGQNTFFAEMGADVYVFDSQGELTLARVCAELRRPEPDLDRVPNLTYLAGDRKTFRRTGREIEDNDMDQNAVDWSTFPTDFVAPSCRSGPRAAAPSSARSAATRSSPGP
jgi:anaerobic magnesium-protoporphyrin IX monomethyl ester cyclase